VHDGATALNPTGTKRLANAIWRPVRDSIRDLLPIIVVIAAFQAFVFRQPLENLGTILVGLTLVVMGLSLFIVGLQMGLFPLGEQMARDFAVKGNALWLCTFAFMLGFGTSFAEPVLIAIADKASEMAIADIGQFDLTSLRRKFAFELRMTVSIAIGLALVLGVLRIMTGWPLPLLIMIGYGLVILLTPLAPASIVAIAYDSGGVATSTITVPLTTALGVGLASSLKGRNPLIDGFGLIALATLLPVVFLLLFGIMRS